jgi:hypothetical protein
MPIYFNDSAAIQAGEWPATRTHFADFCGGRGDFCSSPRIDALCFAMATTPDPDSWIASNIPPYFAAPSLVPGDIEYYTYDLDAT